MLTECRTPRSGLLAILPSIDTWRPWLAQLVADHSALPGYTTLKYSKNGEVFRARLTGRQDESLNVVCRFSRFNGWGIPILGRPYRATRNRSRALQLLQVGIDTAVPLARIERTSRHGPSWLVTEFIADVVDLDQIVLTLLPKQDRRSLRMLKMGLSEALVELLTRLDDARLFHRDLKATNILFTHWDSCEDPPRPMLVDLDGLHRRHWWNRHRRWQPLIRLAASLKDYPALTRTDFARFLNRYLLRAGTRTAEWKAHFRRLTRQATAYAQHSQRRKHHKLDGFTGA